MWDRTRPFRGWQRDATGTAPSSYARYLVDVISHTSVRGQPFSSRELVQAVDDAITHAPPRTTARGFGQPAGRPTSQEAHA